PRDGRLPPAQPRAVLLTQGQPLVCVGLAEGPHDHASAHQDRAARHESHTWHRTTEPSLTLAEDAGTHATPLAAASAASEGLSGSPTGAARKPPLLPSSMRTSTACSTPATDCHE